MIRNCFLCGNKTDVLYQSTWMLPGLTATEIGFSICPQCGSVCQSPTVPFEQMMRFYSSIAVYTNPGRAQKPSAIKIRDLDEQVQFIKRAIGRLPKSALQIGSSDGYTLSRFKSAGVERVLGVEPSEASIKIAKERYNIDSINSSVEAFHTDEKFELIVLTHVLEHLYQPQDTLKKCRLMQQTADEGFIYVEVPLLAMPQSLCPGFFSFEHINYYTRENLIKSLTDSGYYPCSLVEHYNSNLSPIIGILASTREQQHHSPFINQYENNKATVLQYRQLEVSYWQQQLDLVMPQLKAAERIFLWGAGIHTCQVVANTTLLEQVHISGLTDTSPLKWGLQQGQWQCVEPDAIDWQQGDCVIISSYASENEIYQALQWLRDKGVVTVRLHNFAGH